MGDNPSDLDEGRLLFLEDGAITHSVSGTGLSVDVKL